MEMFGPQLGAVVATMRRDEWGLWTATVSVRHDTADGPVWEEVLGIGPCDRQEAAMAVVEVLDDIDDTMTLLPDFELR